MKQKDIDRFWKRINKTSNCWEWINPTHPFGYGRLKVGKGVELAHRISYKIHHGPITSSDCVLHKCDNPKCVNPSHLCIGSRKDNAVDRCSKDRTLKGSNVPTAIFTEQQVLDIRASTKSVSAIAKEYNVGYGTIWSIIKRVNWRHI